ncbi:MAG: hypothetical protein QXH80_00535 [Candidatus Nanoarchaeia archaeon]
MEKAQSSIIGFLLITAIALVIVGTTFFFAVPTIDKTRNQDEVVRIENRMIETHAAIKKVANEQTQMTVPFNIREGILTLDNNNTLIYEANMRLPNVFSPHLLIGNDTDEIGTLGLDEPGYLLEQASVEMRLHYIILNDSAGNCYGVQLRAAGQVAAGAGDHFIFFRWAGENTSTVPGCATTTRQIIDVSIT